MSMDKIIPYKKCLRCGNDMELEDFQTITTPIDPDKMKWMCKNCPKCPKCGSNEHVSWSEIHKEWDCYPCSHSFEGEPPVEVDAYVGFVTSKAMELGGETCTHTKIERRGGYVQFIAEDALIHQTRGYYNMNRYMTEHWDELKEALWKLSEAGRQMESQLNDTSKEKKR